MEEVEQEQEEEQKEEEQEEEDEQEQQQQEVIYCDKIVTVCSCELYNRTNTLHLYSMGSMIFDRKQHVIDLLWITYTGMQ